MLGARLLRLRGVVPRRLRWEGAAASGDERMWRRPSQIWRRELHVQTEDTPNPHSRKFVPVMETPATLADGGRFVSPEELVGRDGASPPVKETEAAVSSALTEPLAKGVFFQTKEDARACSPLASALFAHESVRGVMLTEGFVTVTKEEDEDWERLAPAVFATLLNYFAAAAQGATAATTLADEAAEAAKKRAVAAAVAAAATATDGEGGDGDRAAEHGNEDDDPEGIVATIMDLIETRVRPTVQADGGDIFFRRFDHGTGMVELQLAGSCSGCPSSQETLKDGVERMLMHYVPEVRGVEEYEDEETQERNRRREEATKRQAMEENQRLFFERQEQWRREREEWSRKREGGAGGQTGRD